MLLVSETASSQPGNDATVLLKDMAFTIAVLVWNLTTTKNFERFYKQILGSKWWNNFYWKKIRADRIFWLHLWNPQMLRFHLWVYMYFDAYSKTWLVICKYQCHILPIQVRSRHWILVSCGHPWSQAGRTWFDGAFRGSTCRMKGKCPSPKSTIKRVKQFSSHSSICFLPLIQLQVVSGDKQRKMVFIVHKLVILSKDMFILLNRKFELSVFKS